MTFGCIPGLGMLTSMKKFCWTPWHALALVDGLYADHWQNASGVAHISKQEKKLHPAELVAPIGVASQIANIKYKIAARGTGHGR